MGDEDVSVTLDFAWQDGSSGDSLALTLDVDDVTTTAHKKLDVIDDILFLDGTTALDFEKRLHDKMPEISKREDKLGAVLFRLLRSYINRMAASSQTIEQLQRSLVVEAARTDFLERQADERTATDQIIEELQRDLAHSRAQNGKLERDLQAEKAGRHNFELWTLDVLKEHARLTSASRIEPAPLIEPAPPLEPAPLLTTSVTRIEPAILSAPTSPSSTVSPSIRPAIDLSNQLFSRQGPVHLKR